MREEGPERVAGLSTWQPEPDFPQSVLGSRVSRRWKIPLGLSRPGFVSEFVLRDHFFSSSQASQARSSSLGRGGLQGHKQASHAGLRWHSSPGSCWAGAGRWQQAGWQAAHSLDLLTTPPSSTQTRRLLQEQYHLPSASSHHICIRTDVVLDLGSVTSTGLYSTLL